MMSFVIRGNVKCYGNIDKRYAPLSEEQRELPTALFKLNLIGELWLQEGGGRGRGWCTFSKVIGTEGTSIECALRKHLSP